MRQPVSVSEIACGCIAVRQPVWCVADGERVEAEAGGEPDGAGGLSERGPQPEHGALQAEEQLRGGPGAAGDGQQGEQEPPG